MNDTTVWLEPPRHFTDEKRSFSSNTMTALFTVEHNRAKQHHVRIGLQNDREVEIVAPDLHPGDMAERIVRGDLSWFCTIQCDPTRGLPILVSPVTA